MIIVIPGVFSPTEVERIRGHLDAADWQDGNATAGAQAQQVKQNQQLPLDSQLTRQLGEIILSTLGKHPTFISAALPLKIFPPMFNRYRTGETYGLHVDNAIRYTPEKGEIALTVDHAPQDQYAGNWARLRVRDNGVGIPGGLRSRIFEPFSDVGSAKHHTSSGPDSAGLGLYIARGLIDLHGGLITVESEEGEFTEFTVLLPLAVV